ncbi:hypothetical protein B5807_07439 [Epicoccum nigrum]|uniref:Mid2 domain-containing protein n=1 Tax=Epicoccum nigrum TaxID=105696 RepID=A0A1Y2LUN5_EPING|nr:hypothetical protein B5807_07439 [Epicoccum nigrum]
MSNIHAKALAASVLLTGSFAALVTPSAVTSDPTITPGPNFELFRKQNNDQYIGWVSYSGSWSSVECEAGATYYQTGGHWRCCGTTSAGCEIPQACVNGNLIYNGAVIGASTSVTLACTDVYPDPTDASFTVCNTAFMYENSQDSSPQTNVNCGVSSLNWSYYRVQPDAAKTTAISSARRSATAAASTTDSDGSADTDTATPTDISTTTEKKKSSSKAWIAGAVIGPLLGLALIALLLLFLLRRKKKSKAAAAASAPPVYAAQPQPQPHPAPTNPAPAPQYYPPPMQQQQNTGAMAPFGVADAKPTVWTPQPQSPVSQVSSPNTQSLYGGQYPQQGGYSAPSPSMSPPPPPAVVQEVGGGNFGQQGGEARPFSSELDGSEALRK